MDSFGAYCEGGWDFCSSDFSMEDTHFTPNFLGSNSLTSSYPAPEVTAGNINDTWFCSLDSFNTDLACVLGATTSHDNNGFQQLSNSIDQLPRISDDPMISISIDAGLTGEEKNLGCVFPESTNASLEEITDVTAFSGEDGCGNTDVDTVLRDKVSSPANAFHHKRTVEVPADEIVNNTCSSPGNPNKKIRASRNGQKERKPSHSKKIQKLSTPPAGKCEQDENGAASDIHSSSSYNSEDDNSSQETNARAAALNSNAKTRASRGSATDPQSLYARKRRERINERLKILQKLVPNGTKVDISTMLEEAVHYVKFLQLQIKLLSSDDMWMYAPIAYNGMDIGLQQKLFPFS